VLDESPELHCFAVKRAATLVDLFPTFVNLFLGVLQVPNGFVQIRVCRRSEQVGAVEFLLRSGAERSEARRSHPHVSDKFKLNELVSALTCGRDFWNNLLGMSTKP
tara:strand:- start:175 stop:492 length:318 start_codon:yes stop_codon:yes gene_type:complete